MSFPSFTIASSTRIDPQLGAASSPFGSMLGRAATGLLGTGSPWSVSDLVPAAANRMGMPDGDAAQFFLNQPGALQSVLGQDGFLQQQRLQAMSLGQLSAPPTGAIPGVYPQEPSTATEGDLAAATRTLLKHMGEGKDKRMSVEQLQQCAASGNSEVSQAARTLLSNPQHLQKVLDEGGNLTHESARKGALSPEEAQAAKKIVE